jgi:hypothetical protein
MPQTPEPLYDPSRVNAAFQLRYSWTGWPSGGAFPCTPCEILATIKDDWERKDGLRLLEPTWETDHMQLLFSAKPCVSPVLLAKCVKGRLDHALRKAGLTMQFSRKLGVRSVGETTRKDVEAYIEQQVPNSRFADQKRKAGRQRAASVRGGRLAQR